MRDLIKSLLQYMHSVILVHSYIMNIHVIQTHYLIWVNSKLFCACLYSNCKRLVLKLQMNTSFIKSWNVLAPILHISTAPMSYCKICASRNAQSCMQGILNSAVCITSHEKRISKKEQKKKKKVCNPLRGSSQRTGCPLRGCRLFFFFVPSWIFFSHGR